MPPVLNQMKSTNTESFAVHGEEIDSRDSGNMEFDKVRSESRLSREAFTFDKPRFDIEKMLIFEERLKKDENIKKLMQMSPSVPNGFNMNCTQMDEKDFSTIICQGILSNEHLLGLKE